MIKLKKEKLSQRLSIMPLFFYIFIFLCDCYVLYSSIIIGLKFQSILLIIFVNIFLLVVFYYDLFKLKNKLDK